MVYSNAVIAANGRSIVGERGMQLSMTSAHSSALQSQAVTAAGIPFRETHHISGAAVKLAEDKGCQLSDLTTQDLQGINQLFSDDVQDVWDFNRSALSKQCCKHTDMYHQNVLLWYKFLQDDALPCTPLAGRLQIWPPFYVASSLFSTECLLSPVIHLQDTGMTRRSMLCTVEPCQC